LLTLSLQEEYGSVLDESLIILIANERDLVKDYAEIRDVLDQLAGPARAEAATGFDPSGLGSLAELEGLRLDETTTSGNGLDSSADYSTSISEFSDQSENQRFTELADLTDEQKIQELNLVFQGRFRDHTLAYILKQTGGDFERAFDELLNRQHLEDSGSLPKGIDGFFKLDEDEYHSKPKSGRSRKGNAKNKKQVVDIKYKAVSSTVDDGDLESARDFAQPANSRATLPRRFLPSTPTLLPAITTPRSAPTPALSSPVTSDFGAASMRAAASLRRMGPLGRQGAVVYTERAREERGAFTVHASQAAEALVNQQSTATVVDLHGVFVMDGVRIAKQRVWAWWNGLGENRKALARQSGFTIVTGVGKHSAGGVSRLRQAVGAFLKNDGWRVETLTGKFYVTGRV
jgi:hypothetical protein